MTITTAAEAEAVIAAREPAGSHWSLVWDKGSYWGFLVHSQDNRGQLGLYRVGPRGGCELLVQLPLDTWHAIRGAVLVVA